MVKEPVKPVLEIIIFHTKNPFPAPSITPGVMVTFVLTLAPAPITTPGVCPVAAA
jgi:hypothetical protein